MSGATMAAAQFTPPVWLTIEQVGEYMSISRSSAYTLVDSGKIRSYPLGPGGGAIRVKLDDLTAYLESVARGGEQQPVDRPKAAPVVFKHLRPRPHHSKLKKSAAAGG